MNLYLQDVSKHVLGQGEAGLLQSRGPIGVVHELQGVEAVEGKINKEGC